MVALIMKPHDPYNPPNSTRGLIHSSLRTKSGLVGIQSTIWKKSGFPPISTLGKSRLVFSGQPVKPTTHGLYAG